MADLTDLERTIRNRLDAIGPAPRAVLLQVLMLPNHERATMIGEFYRDPRTQTFAQLLIDLEESPHARTIVIGETTRARASPPDEGLERAVVDADEA